jgi:hypothetical protein
MVMLVYHTEITARHKGRSGLRRVKPYIQFFCLYCFDLRWWWSAGYCTWGCPCLPYIGRQTMSVDRSPGRLQQGNLSLVGYNMESLSELP